MGLKGQCDGRRPYAFCNDFTGSEIIKICNCLFTQSVRRFNMACRAGTMHVGRPRKHSNGWESVNSRICLSIETLSQWRRLRHKRDLSDDNAVTVYLRTRAP